ncbi:hypothetical protein WT27_12750 [Burkholderia territorii]|uniref:Uncharacterized protein n=1 Tax=Burkholderia territorii TaxID=1503055 RepID=A0A105V3P6_9BURK|nr:hypothetical protein [Burkholderia territorii]KVV40795.1 hypothetical protein WT27_12750 [Burkholderia territorii]KVX33742.1 hypothetical protein WT31_08650 [Burkholderia territorii]
MEQAISAAGEVRSIEACRRQIVMQFSQFAEGVTTAVPAPTGHYWHVDVKHETTWYLGCAIQSTTYGASFSLRKTFSDGVPEDTRDRTVRCSVEVRFFWPEQTVVDPRGRKQVLRQYSDRFGATVFADWGGIYAGCNVPLLEGRATSCYAKSVADLIDATASTLRSAFANLPTPPRGLHLTEYVIERMLATGSAQDKTEYARSIGYIDNKRVVVVDGRVVTHRWKDWFEFCDACRRTTPSL